MRRKSLLSHLAGKYKENLKSMVACSIAALTKENIKNVTLYYVFFYLRNYYQKVSAISCIQLIIVSGFHSTYINIVKQLPIILGSIIQGWHFLIMACMFTTTTLLLTLT